jgi:hypothetical protein
MSIAPCQVCGGTGFIDAPAPDRESAPQVAERPPIGDQEESTQVEKIPCPVCAGSGSNTGV